MSDLLKHDLIDCFNEEISLLNGETELSFFKRKKNAIKNFEHLGIPSSKLEEWKYTNLSQILKGYKLTQSKKTHTAETIKSELIKESNLVVIQDGFYNDELSNIIEPSNKVIIGGFEKSRESQSSIYDKYFASTEEVDINPMYQLNTACSKDGVFIHIPDGHILEYPIHIIYLNSAQDKNIISHPRNLIVIGKNAQADIVESYNDLCNNVVFNNIAHEIFIDEYAILNYTKLQSISESNLIVDTTQISQKKGSVINTHTFSNGGKLIRNDLNIYLNDEHIESNIYGLSCGDSKSHIDHHTIMDHKYANCLSNELYKGIYRDQSRGVFNGKVYVREGAQKTNAFQSNPNLLLSDDARIDTKPQLEIFADDVKCSHGATIGQLEDDAIFYMQSRGIDKSAAKGILSYAFASEFIESIKHKTLKKHLRNKVLEFLDLNLD